MPALIGAHIFALAAEAVFCYNITVFDRLRALDEDGAELALRLGDEVETVVHAQLGAIGHPISNKFGRK